MKIRWREHELIVATMIGAIMLAGHIWIVLYSSPDRIYSIFSEPFITNHVPFNIYRNALFPYIGLGLLIYLSYLFVNFFTIRRFNSPGKFNAGASPNFTTRRKKPLGGVVYNFLKNYLWVIIQGCFLILIIGIGINIA